MELNEVIPIVEALLIATPEPLTEKRYRQALGIEDDQVPPLAEVIAALQEHYETDQRAFTIFEVAGGYQIVTKPEFQTYIKRLYHKGQRLRLSQAALETLAVITYRQPVTRAVIDNIRGVSSESSLRTLLERHLIEIAGRDEGPGRPLLYRTSTQFLQYFGLKSLADLPPLKEAESLFQNEEENLL